ncbi:MAG: sodium:proton exchanger [Myxococcales bacterium]|nr:sodium:proton exchanger [Myxococcales bacterium]
MDLWVILSEMLLLLGAAFVLGAAAERLRQSAIIGYLLAGSLLGPFLFNTEAVSGIAELGVSLLLFSLGLEFSLRRLRSLGPVAFGGGAVQVVGTLAVFAGVAALFRSGPEALVIGAMAALSSTAVVLRVIADRGETDSVRGRNALGILLLQDMAVVPLVLLVTMLGTSGGEAGVIRQLGQAVAAAVVLAVVFYLLFYHLVPRLLFAGEMQRTRELVILLTILAALGSAWGAHALGLSPALGAFIAGMLLGESPFASQMNADIGTLKTLCVTLFFASIGMLAKPAFLFWHLPLVLAVVAIVLALKTLAAYGALRLFRQSRLISLATAISLAQIGEFSFVLATTAQREGILQGELFDLLVAVTIVTLFITPYLVAYARPLAERLLRRRANAGETEAAADPDVARVLIVGFGPAGQSVAAALRKHEIRPAIVDQNPRTVLVAREQGLPAFLGDAGHGDVLLHAGVRRAEIVAVTVPNPQTSRQIIESVRALAGPKKVVARARYHVLRWEPEIAGATVVVDEEEQVGLKLAEEVERLLPEMEPRSPED